MGFLIGSALGALAGIFFAPKAGNKLRSDIRNKGNEIIKNSKDIYGDAGKKAKEIIKDAKQRAEALNKKPIDFSRQPQEGLGECSKPALG